jgi:hypothetical protein
VGPVLPVGPVGPLLGGLGGSGLGSEQSSMILQQHFTVRHFLHLECPIFI